jgi:pimeloyl-ACP methyl ester esterase
VSQLGYQWQGLDAAPCIVLLNGWGYRRLAWPVGWLQRLGRFYRLLLVDLPASSSDSHTLCMEQDLSSWIKALLQVIPSQSVVLGWSLGGMLALQLAQQSTHKIAGLVLLASNIKFVQCSEWPWALPAADLNHFRQAFQCAPNQTLRRFCTLQTQGEQDRSLFRLLLTQLSAKPSIAGLNWLQQLDLRLVWRDLSVPCLALYGTGDTLIPAEVQPQLILLQPKARICVFQGGHAFFWSRAHVLEQIQVFLHHILPVHIAYD